MVIIKKVGRKSLVLLREDSFLKKKEFALIKKFPNSFSVKTYLAWYPEGCKRTSRIEGKQEFIGKGFVELLSSL